MAGGMFGDESLLWVEGDWGVGGGQNPGSNLHLGREFKGKRVSQSNQLYIVVLKLEVH